MARVKNLKQIIKHQKLLKSGVIEAPFTIPGEPMIYSLKYDVGKRTTSLNVFRNMQWKSMLKCFFASQYKTSTPVVLLVRFYVTPPPKVSVDKRHLLGEKIPATHSFELCDYVLSFIEMLHHVLINSYRQIVKLDLEKYYSSDPRTVFQFMRWSDYAELQNLHPIHPKSQGVGKDGSKRSVQSKCSGNEASEKLCDVPASGSEAPVVHRPSASCSPVSHTCCAKHAGEKTPTAKLPTTYKAPRWRQPREVSE